jgi:hypothetical protein
MPLVLGHFLLFAINIGVRIMATREGRNWGRVLRWVGWSRRKLGVKGVLGRGRRVEFDE